MLKFRMRTVKTIKRISLIFFILILIIIFSWLSLEKKPRIIWTRSNSLVFTSPSPFISDQVNRDSLITALDYSLVYYEKLDPERKLTFGPHQYTVLRVKKSIMDFKEKLLKHGLTPDFFNYLKNNYFFYQSAASRVLFTGYYEASLKGSLQKTENFKYPLYKKPEDLIQINLSKYHFFEKFPGLPKIIRGRITDRKQIIPYYSREEIDFKNQLQGKELEIVWIDDPVDVFFLQIQGSGIIQLKNGGEIRANYADSNGHPYRAIGRLLIERNIFTKNTISMQGIRKYLKKHPEELEEIFNYNPSYVFFRTVKDGPRGFLDVPVTPFRSIATDKRLFPPGAICYIETKIPVFNITGNVIDSKKISCFVLNQDTGGAIRTPKRVDLFTGHGKSSELIAGHLKQEGQLFFLIKK